MPLKPHLTGFGFRNHPEGDRIQGARPYQEDDYGIWRDREGWLVMVVADGLGGHRGGAEARRTAVETFYAALDAAEGDPGARMTTALNIANNAIGVKSFSEIRYFGMGCTLVACVVVAGEVRWTSAGDPPLWKISAEASADAAATGSTGPTDSPGIERLNEDHSKKALARRLLREGSITEAEAAACNPNELLSALVGNPVPQVDRRSAALESGAWLLLASDGLETLPESEIERICREKRRPLEVVKGLLAEVEAAGKPGQDNATAVVYRHR